MPTAQKNRSSQDRQNAAADRRSDENTTGIAEQSAEQFSQLFGVGGDPEQTAQRYNRSVEALQECGGAVAKGYQDISREYVSWVQGQFQTTLSTFSRLAQCRTPQELIAVQNQLFGENIALMLNANRRFAEIAKEMADRAAEKITDLADQTEQEQRRAA